MTRPFLIAVAAVVVLGLAAVAGIFYATQPAWFASWSDAPPAQPSAAAPGLPPVQGNAPPIFLPPDHDASRPSPTTPRPPPEGYHRYDPPIITAAPPKVMPRKREERQQVVVQERKDKFASAMDALNRRTAAKVGNSNPIPPSAPPFPSAYNSRRGVLSAADPVRRPEQAQQ